MLEAQHIVFKVQEQIYGLNIAHIQEIIKMKDICETPNSTRPYLKGVINVRGIIIPVISMSERLALDQKEETFATRIIITEADDQFVGIIVDEIVNVEAIQTGPIPETVREEVRSICNGMGYLGDKIIPILQLSNVLEVGSEKK